jgi:DNA modification methylase
MSEKHDYDLGTLYHGDCLEVLRELPADSLDSVVTDPPAGIAFMGKGWDDPNAWQYPISKHGFTDGGDRVAAPAITTARNPNCRKCKRHKRGWKDIPGCECAQPDFDGLEKHLESRDIFVSWLTEVMRECLRVLKPGGHALVWSIPRTSHWTGTALEEAGFEVRDSILHLFGQGFPKSLNIGKAIDKMKGAERPVVGSRTFEGKAAQDWKDKAGHTFSGGGASAEGLKKTVDVTAPATPEAAEWEGWGTSLKPAVEIWWLVRKPLREKTVAEQVLKTGTGGINVDGSRVDTNEDLNGGAYSGQKREKAGTWQSEDRSEGKGSGFRPGSGEYQQPQGRWPANVVLTHSPECKQLGTKKVKGITGGTTVVRKGGMNPDDARTASAAGRFAAKQQPDRKGYSDESGEEAIVDWECAPGCPVGALNDQSGSLKSGKDVNPTQGPVQGFFGSGQNYYSSGANYGDSGGASRFFHNFEPDYDVPFFYTGKITSGERKEDLEEEGLINKHPTVKTQKLMTFLIKLITPPGGTVLDPFAGSGSTLVAAVNNGFRFIGVERDPEYLKIARGRLDKAVEREILNQEQQDVFDELMGG